MKWIKCSEQWPPTNIKLVLFGNIYPTFVGFWNGRKWREYADEEMKYRKSDVTHWLLLPDEPQH